MKTTREYVAMCSIGGRGRRVAARWRAAVCGVCLVWLCALLACGERQVGPEPVARVNGEEIALAAHETRLARALARYPERGRDLPPEIRARISGHVLRQMIDEVLVRQHARAERIRVDPTEVERAFATHRDAFSGSAKLHAYLRERDENAASHLAQLHHHALLDRFLGQVDERERGQAMAALVNELRASARIETLAGGRQ